MHYKDQKNKLVNTLLNNNYDTFPSRLRAVIPCMFKTMAFVLFIVGALLLNSCEQKKKKAKVIVTQKVVVKNKVQKDVYGIDISKYQGDEMDFINKKKDSLNFIICKATEGITYTDPKFIYNWKMIKEKGFIRGAYHFYRSEDDPVEQANNYLKAIASSIELNNLPPIIDFEGGGIDKETPVDAVKSTLLVFLNKIEKDLKRRPIIYTNTNIGNLYLNDSMFSKYPLWIANYTNNKSPDLPIVWKSIGWSLWQKSENYEVDNITDDFDTFNGDLTEFKKFIKNSSNKDGI